jgi:hypothetical protein
VRTPIDVSKLGPEVGERVPDFSLKRRRAHVLGRLRLRRIVAHAIVENPSRASSGAPSDLSRRQTAMEVAGLGRASEPLLNEYQQLAGTSTQSCTRFVPTLSGPKVSKRFYFNRLKVVEAGGVELLSFSFAQGR